MANENDLSDLLNKIPVEDLANQLGASTADVSNAVSRIVPGLLGGMAVNSQADGGAALEKALEQHRREQVTYELSSVDQADGKKIVEKVFGTAQGEAISSLSEAAGGQAASLVPDMLPMIAPLIMEYLANSVLGSPGKAPRKGQGSVGDLLGGLLGGGKQGGFDLGTLLSGSGSWGSLLGSFLGRKR